MSHIRTLLLLLVGVRLFGAGESSTEPLSRVIQTTDYTAIQPSRVFSLLYLSFGSNRIPKTTVKGEKVRDRFSSLMAPRL